MMPPITWCSWLLVTFIAVASATELVPEKFLRPRNFNHHPFTDVGSRPTPKPLLVLAHSNPYAVLSQKKPREGREFARQDVVFYPSPHPSVLPTKKYLDTNEIGGYDDPYANVPKNYAFSYIVRDHQSGDDFSHSQAHNGKATRGQYRVKLPDGRVQVVSYTADHKGYRADVQYEEDPEAKHTGPLLAGATATPTTALPSPTPTIATKYEAPEAHQVVHYVPSYVPEPSNHLSNPSTVLPKDYVATSNQINLVLVHSPRPTEAVHYVDRITEYIPSTQATPYASKEQYVSTTPRYDEPYQQQLVTPTPTPYVPQPYSASHGYEILASPTPEVLVTPRTLINAAALRKNQQEHSNQQQQQHVIYKFV